MEKYVWRLNVDYYYFLFIEESFVHEKKIAQRYRRIQDKSLSMFLW